MSPGPSFSLSERDIVVSVWTDSMDLYRTRSQEMQETYGPYSELVAGKDYHRYLMAATTDHFLELRFPDKRRINHLKYFTWIEQQDKV
jgi:hypothetical protein